MATFKFSELHFYRPSGGHTTAGSKVPPDLNAGRKRSPVGLYSDVLLDRGIEFNRIHLDLGEALPNCWPA